MSDRLPIIDILADCENDRERAGWLYAVPYGVILRDYAVIREILTNAGFEAGAKCLDAEFALLTRRRNADGSLPFLAIDTARMARADMAAALRQTGDIDDAT